MVVNIKYNAVLVNGSFPLIKQEDIGSLVPFPVVVVEGGRVNNSEIDSNHFIPKSFSSQDIVESLKPNYHKEVPNFQSIEHIPSVIEKNIKSSSSLFSDYIFSNQDEKIIESAYAEYKKLTMDNKKAFGWIVVLTIVFAFLIQFGAIFVLLIGFLLNGFKNLSKVNSLRKDLRKVISYNKFAQIANKRLRIEG